MSTIDVLVPCYGYGRYLKACVESALSQIGPDVRVLIIDDASPDETPEVARRLAQLDARVSYVRHEMNRGHIATYNEGIDWASADYTLLLSADDWVLPGAFARAVAVMESDSSVGFVHGLAIAVYADEVPAEPERPNFTWTIQNGEAFLHKCRLDNPVVTCTAVVRTALQKRIGGYRPELPHSGDLEMWMRFAAHGSVGQLNAIQGVYRRHARNMSIQYNLNPILDLQQRQAAIELFLQTAGKRLKNPSAVRHMLRRGLAEAAVSCATSGHSYFDETMKFAESLDPTIKNTLGWRRQHLKRWLGPERCARISGIKHICRQLLNGC